MNIEIITALLSVTLFISAIHNIEGFFSCRSLRKILDLKDDSIGNLLDALESKDKSIKYQAEMLSDIKGDKS